MTKLPNVQPLRIADAVRGIRHVFIRNLELLAQIGIYGHEQVMQDGERIAHAEIIIGDSHVMLADEHLEIGAKAPEPGSRSPVGIMLYVADVDAVFSRAVEAGATVERPLADQFYGDRTGGIVDPFGHNWYLATHLEDVSPEEMNQRMKAQAK